MTCQCVLSPLMYFVYYHHIGPMLSFTFYLQRMRTILSGERNPCIFYKQIYCGHLDNAGCRHWHASNICRQVNATLNVISISNRFLYVC